MSTESNVYSIFSDIARFCEVCALSIRFEDKKMSMDRSLKIIMTFFIPNIFSYYFIAF